MTETLRTEIAAAETRRATFSAELDIAVREHEAAKRDISTAEDKDASLREVTLTHARRTALEDALKALDLQLEQQRELLSNREAEESRAETLKRIKACRSEREKAAVEYRKRRIAAHSALEKAIQPTFEALKKWQELTYEQRELEKSIGEAHDQLVARIDGVEGLHPFGNVVDAAIKIAGESLRANEVNRLRKEAQTRRDAAEQRETERVNAMYKEAAERAHQGLRLGPKAA